MSVLVRAKRLCLSGSITSPHACGSLRSVMSSLRVQNNRLCLFLYGSERLKRFGSCAHFPFIVSLRYTAIVGSAPPFSPFLPDAFKQKIKFCIIEGSRKPRFCHFLTPNGGCPCFLHAFFSVSCWLEDAAFFALWVLYFMQGSGIFSYLLRLIIGSATLYALNDRLQTSGAAIHGSPLPRSNYICRSERSRASG